MYVAQSPWFGDMNFVEDYYETPKILINKSVDDDYVVIYLSDCAVSDSGGCKCRREH